MKKYILSLFLVGLSLVLVPNLDLVSAQSITLPEGCSSTVGYSPITGVKCDSVISTNLPAGCSSIVGYSPITGIKCDSKPTNLPLGCTSVFGYSPVTGLKCDSIATPTTPSITVLSPNGGETYKDGQQITVKWTSSNISADHQVNLVLAGYDSEGKMRIYLLLSQEKILNDGIETVNLPDKISTYAGINFGKYFKVEISDNGEGHFDSSDNLFTIISSTDTGLPPGCTSSTGYSSTTGQSCGCNGTVYSTYSGQLCPTSTTSSITVLSPNGGETYKAGDILKIRWNSQNLLQSDTVKIELRYNHNDPSYGAGTYFEDWIIEKTVNTGSYDWVIPKYYSSGAVPFSFTVKVSSGNIIDYSNSKFNIVQEIIGSDITVTSPIVGSVFSNGSTVNINWIGKGTDQYTVSLLKKSDPSFLRISLDAHGNMPNLTWKIPSDLLNSSDYFIKVTEGLYRKYTGYSSLFTINSSTVSTPVISGVSGPQTLNVGQEGKWTVTASDSSGGNLSYSVVWGDESNIYPVAMPRYDNTQQTATFYHSYAKAGTYSPIFTVKNTSGQSDKTSLSVNVGNIIVALPFVEIWTTDNDIEYGGHSTIFWQSGNATLCIADGGNNGWKGTKAMTGRYDTGVLNSTTTFFITCSNNSGQAVDSITINVRNTTVNHNPVLNPIAVQSNIQVGQSVPFTFSATDADNDDLGWSVDWGDNSPSIGSTCSSSGNKQTGAGWTWGGSHYWISVGTYNVKVTVLDCKGGTASTNFNVTVTGGIIKGYTNSVSLNSALGAQSANVLGALDNSSDQKKLEIKLDESIDNSQKLTCGEFTMTLKKGMKNEEVKCLQKMLNEKGFKVEGVEKGMETTYFGTATLAALKAFQTNGNLAIDGVFGPASRVALKAITQ